MHIIIAGMGVVGRHVARRLSEEQHNLVLLDSERDALERAGGEVDAMTIRGHAANEKTLLQADVRHCDLFLAVTNSDEVNIIAALRAKHLGARKVIARATNHVYFEEERGLYEDMFGIDLVINPKYLVAIEIHKLIRTRGAIAVEDFVNNQIEMVQLPISDSKATNQTIERIHKDFLPKDVRVVAIIRRGELTIPNGGDLLMPNDEAIFIGRRDDIPKVERLFGRERGRFTRKVIIIGGGDIGTSLARNLAADGVKVHIIERDPRRCEELSEELADCEILHGDGTDAYLLEELGVASCDVFVSVSHEDELNLMASLLAKEIGARRCISLMHKPDYTRVLERLGVDTTLSPRRQVAKEVLKHVRSDNVLSTNQIMGGSGEFIELRVEANTRITQHPIKDLGWPRGSLICAGFGDNGAFIPDGNTIIEPGQRVVIFTNPKARRKLSRFF